MYRGRKGPFYSLSIGTYVDGGRQREIFCFLSARHTHVNTKMSLHLIVLSPLTARLQRGSVCAEQVYSNCEYCKCVRLKGTSQTEQSPSQH